MSERRRYTKLALLTDAERDEHRKEQVRLAQQKYRESHSTVPKVSAEENSRIKKERQQHKAHQRYLKRKEKDALNGKNEVNVPGSYSVEYQRNYHKQYYEKNKEKLLTRSREYYHAKQLTKVNEVNEVNKVNEV